MDIDKNLIDDAAYQKATESGQRLLARGPVAKLARYVAGRIHVELDNGCAFEFPVAHAQELVNAKPADLRQVEVTAAGLGLYWPTLDADLYVPNVLKGVLGTRQWMAHIGATGGKAKTQAKSVAARENGKRGGRPSAKSMKVNS
ncbi:DUF2442 domain-containing protein [Limnohabitans sp. MORI2]|uniref:DUF2442 domain-containing protein n=1 Tax=Limnohabitans sp. MORI2 TaxID=1751150 RepID=UPI0024903A1A|nr:DUF2442 domain-containing protein [Limnohabitans sp. MORI2]